MPDHLTYQYTPTDKKLFVILNMILKRYGCPLIIPESSQCDATSFYSYFFQWHINEKTMMRDLTIPRFYWDVMSNFMKNSNQRFFAFPLILVADKSVMFPNMTPDTEPNSSHVSLVLYDKQTACLERFDSANNNYKFDSFLLDTTITNIFKNTFMIPIHRVKTPQLICTIAGIQTLQEMEIIHASVQPIFGVNAGLCSVFMLWFLEERLAHPDTQPQSIINDAVNRERKSGQHLPLTRMIKQYAMYIDRKYHFLVGTENEHETSVTQFTKKIKSITCYF
jgi:hypothetical protein